MSNNTKNGLICIIIGMIISIIASIILYLSQGNLNIDYFSGLLMLVGIILMLVGRKDYGERHSKFVIYSIILFAISFIITFIFLGIIIASVMSAATDSTLSYREALSPLRNIFLMAPIVSVIGGVLNIFLVYELENRIGKNILFLAFIVTIIISVYVAYEGIQITDKWIDSIDEPEQENNNYFNFGSSYSTDYFEGKVNELQKEINKILPFAIIGKLMYLIAFIIPYQRIKSGELIQSLPSNLKRCMNCGRVNPYDSIMCSYCGHKFDDTQTNDQMYHN